MPDGLPNTDDASLEAAAGTFMKNGRLQGSWRLCFEKEGPRPIPTQTVAESTGKQSVQPQLPSVAEILLAKLSAACTRWVITDQVSQHVYENIVLPRMPYLTTVLSSPAT